MSRGFMLLVILQLISLADLSQVYADNGDIVELFSRATSDNKTDAAKAIGELRSGGRATFENLLKIWDDRRGLGAPVDKDVAAKRDDVIDRVGGQKYCTSSRLYWHTELEPALAEASKNGKPILSLRMLGELTEELSCANSRFFRTMLYANAEISEYLRNHFVLHWESVRPVPKVTIDFGGGRMIECTLGGNSVHYILAPDGRPIDALPGLFGPFMFLEGLREAEAAAKAYLRAAPSQRQALLSEYYKARLWGIARAWQTDLANIPSVASPGYQPTSQNFNELVYPAKSRDSLAKRTENRFWFQVASLTMEALDEVTDGRRWKKIAALHPSYGELDAASLELIRSQTPSDAVKDGADISNNGATVSNVPNPTSFGDIDFRKGGFRSRFSDDDAGKILLGNLQTSIAMDTVRNEYFRHSRLYLCLLVEDRRSVDVNALNRWVYAELFSAPVDDPWVGLISRDVYPALQNGGIVRK